MYISFVNTDIGTILSSELVLSTSLAFRVSSRKNYQLYFSSGPGSNDGNLLETTDPDVFEDGLLPLEQRHHGRQVALGASQGHGTRRPELKFSKITKFGSKLGPSNLSRSLDRVVLTG